MQKAKAHRTWTKVSERTNITKKYKNYIYQADQSKK